MLWSRLFLLLFMALMCFDSVLTSLCNAFVCTTFFFPQLTSFQPLNSIKVETILQRATVGDELFFLRGRILKMCVSFLFCEIFLLQSSFKKKKMFLCCNAFLCNVVFSMVEAGGMLRRWITQLGILSFDIKQSFRVMNQRYIYKPCSPDFTVASESKIISVFNRFSV